MPIHCRSVIDLLGMVDRIRNQMRDMRVGQRIVQVLSMSAIAHQPFAFQQFEPLRDSIHVFIKGQGDFGDAQLLLGQDCQHLQPSRIA